MSTNGVQSLPRRNRGAIMWSMGELLSYPGYTSLCRELKKHSTRYDFLWNGVIGTDDLVFVLGTGSWQRHCAILGGPLAPEPRHAKIPKSQFFPPNLIFRSRQHESKLNPGLLEAEDNKRKVSLSDCDEALFKLG